MAKVHISRPSDEEMAELGVEEWGEWGCSKSTFPWEYDEKETCYIIEGEADIVTDQGACRLGPGDLAVFPKGLQCTWQVKKAIRKYYRFG